MAASARSRSWGAPRCLIARILFAALPALAFPQQEPAPVIGKTSNNAATGAETEWDFGATDLTFKASRGEIWVLDAHSLATPFISSFQVTDLAGPRTRIQLNLPPELAEAPVLGIAEVPHGALQGKNIVLVDPSFGTPDPPQPQIAVYDDSGDITPGESFAAVAGLVDSTRLTAIDVNPVRDEIVAYDFANHALYLLDFTFTVTQGPIPLQGFANFFVREWYFGTVTPANLRGAGAGVAYLGADTVLVSEAFFNRFDTRYALAYDLRNGGVYSGRAIDLGLAGSSGLLPDLAFLGLETATIDNEDVLFADNFGDDAVYAFSALLAQHPAPVTIRSCQRVDPTGEYTIQWTLAPEFAADTFRILENGVEVATLGPAETSFTSPQPFMGKVFLEVVVEKDGFQSALRFVCQLEDYTRPRIPDVTVDAARISQTTIGVLSGVAVTKTPASPEAFRGYIVGQATNDIVVFNHRLEVLEILDLVPSVSAAGTNLPAIGVALLEVDGEHQLAVLDPDGPNNVNGNPSAAIFAATGLAKGSKVRDIAPIDLSNFNPAPFLLDWDIDRDGHFVAGVILPGGGLGLARLLAAGDGLVLTQLAPVPQRLLTPFNGLPVRGCGVAVLASGNILVAGGDTFTETYTEALLVTSFHDEPPAIPRFVGFAQGLIATNQVPPFDYGPGIGPDIIFGLDVAHFPPPADPPPAPDDPGFGVTYLPTGEIFLIQNPSVNLVLTNRGRLLIHGETACSHPDLQAEELSEAGGEVPPSQTFSTGALSPAFTASPRGTDYFYYIINQSIASPARFSVEVRLDGFLVTQATQTLVVPAGRYFRRALAARAEKSIEVTVKNEGAATAQVRIFAGAMAIGTPGSGQPQFRRGDCDTSRLVNITDAIFGLAALFQGGTQPACQDACDADDNGIVNITDMLVLLQHLFQGAGPLPAPGAQACGADPTSDDALSPCLYDQGLCP